MPSGLDIHHKRILRGSVAPYDEHLIIHTGTSDWPSKIEDDVRFKAAVFKAAIRREYIHSSPEKPRPQNVLISLSSLPLHERGSSSNLVSLSLMKRGQNLLIAEDKLEAVAMSAMGLQSFDALKSHPGTASGTSESPVEDALVFICGHNQRDTRCGIMGPLLEGEFAEKLQGTIRYTLALLTWPLGESIHNHQVGLISHVGGHAFAGNVIIYIPVHGQFRNHPLAGKGVWYGRVEPRHVQGIVQQTIQKGVVIEELLRGVI
jgi:hypothetical protein